MVDKQAVLEGTVERITFRNDDNGYTVLRLLPETDDDTSHQGRFTSAPMTAPVTVVGRFPAVAVGERLRLWGRWVHHPQYGRQLSVTDFAVVAPSTLEGIRRYLGSGLIRGIGPGVGRSVGSSFRVGYAPRHRQCTRASSESGRHRPAAGAGDRERS